MAQILVRDLDDGVVEKLREKAKAHSRSLEAEVRWLLGEAAAAQRLDHDAAVRSLAALRGRIKGRKLPNSTGLLREDREG